MSALHQILAALFFNGMDLITGIVGGLKEHKVCSAKLRDGLFKKVGFVFCYLLGWFIDSYGSLIGFSLPVSVLPVVVTYAVTTEIVSIIENIHRINPEILPEKLKSIFKLGGEED